MTDMNRWALKIHAFLHDPPHKPLALGRGHGRQGATIASLITGSAPSEKAKHTIEQADHLAAGADRHNWLRDLQVNPRDELQLLHPLEGKPILQPGTTTAQAFELRFPSECVDAAEELGMQVAQAISAVSEPRLRFLVLWRFLPELLTRLEAKGQKLGLLWSLLPADSRMPEHSVLVHDSLVAALASILDNGQEAALLRVQFAPVQNFIEASRKLRDLWASSSILAETTWKALEPIVQELGPDHVIYPNLRHEPRFDRWLLHELRNEPALAVEGEKAANVSALWQVVDETRSHLDRSLRTPSLPNVFTAVVPLNNAASLAEQIETMLRNFWATSVATSANRAGDGYEFVSRAEEQARALLQVFWSVVPWPLHADPKAWLSDNGPKFCWHKSNSTTAAALETLDQLPSAAFAAYRPNAGLLYADLNEQAGLLVDAVKRERVQHANDEEGLKCSCCGERQVLGGNDFWIQRTAGFQKRRDQKQLSENEQLCGPCTWKRHFDVQGLGAEGSPTVGQGHPSTGDIAASQFKLDVIQQCVDGNGELLHAVEDFVAAVKEDQKAGKLDENEVRVFCPQAVYVAATRSRNDTLEQFARIDGQWLLPFPREEADQGPPERTLQAARKLRRAAATAKIAAPRPYLAVIEFDGDGMGKWLSGSHEKFPSLKETLHLKAIEQIEAKSPNSSAFLSSTKRFLTPAFHASISAAAASFARLSAPMTVEGEGLPGHLVYAGGDDALFLAPIPAAVELAWRLRLRFSGWPSSFEKELVHADPLDFQAAQNSLTQWLHTPSPWVVARLSPNTGRPRPVSHWTEADRLGLAFGTRATASAGLCVFHYRWPLGSALHLAREALAQAKNRGRNALGVVVQRRSGSVSTTVLPFFIERNSASAGKAQSSTAWPVLSLLRAIAAFGKEERQVSTRLASGFRSEIAALHVLPRAGRLASGTELSLELWEMGAALARRVVRRLNLPGGEQARKQLEELVLELGHGVRSPGRQSADLALYEWAEALTVAAFLARPGERE